MKPRHIFYHPVGTFPAGARWYLAGIAVFVLLCTAMHLSIQIQAQQRAELLVQQWAKQAGVQINRVHYHLLRNALILQDIQMHQGDDTAVIKHLLVRMNPESLNGPAPQVRLLKISGLEMEIHPQSEHQTWLKNEALMKIWQATSSFHLQHGHVKLFPQQHDLMPLVINNISIQQQLQSGTRSMNASAKLQHGSLQWEIITDQQNNRSEGRFSWHHIDSRQLTDILALEPLKGQLNGELTWHEEDPYKAINMQGELYFLSDDTFTNKVDHGQKTHPLHQLQFSASQNSNNIWNINLHAKAWPLAPWSGFIPTFGDRQLQTAQLDGSIHWQGEKDGEWNINGSAGVVQHVIFAPVEKFDSNKSINNSSIWRIQQINYEGFKLNTSRRHLQLSHLKINDSKITFNTTTGTHSNPQPAPPPPRRWFISADDILVDHMTLSITMPGGELILPSLSGHGEWSEQQHLAFELATENQKSSSDTNWHLRGSVTNNITTQQLPDAEISITARDIPMAILRPLLPLPSDASSPITLKGKIDLQSNLDVDQGRWRIQGKASGREIQLSHAGNIWMAEKVDSLFGPIGMALETQQIHQTQVENWSYIAALAPLQATPHYPVIQQTAWWASALRNKGVEIDQLNMKNGSLSIGNKESLWAEHIDIHIDNLAAKQWANITATADVGSGLFELNGAWDATSQPQRFSGSASLQHALPFFLQPWMRASGMPHLIRGYLDASLNIHHNAEEDRYQSSWQLQLLRTLTEDGNLANDPMLSRTGFNTKELIAHLGDADGSIKLMGNITGTWQQQPLSFDIIGKSLQSSLHQAVLRQSSLQDEKREYQSPTTTDSELMATIPNTQFRLHGREPLSLNERSRLYKTVQLLRIKQHMSIDLRPHWSGNQLDNETVAKIQRTQALIKRYMTHRNIDPQRIFPRWPTASDQVQEISSIQIEFND